MNHYRIIKENANKTFILEEDNGFFYLFEDGRWTNLGNPYVSPLRIFGEILGYRIEQI